MRQRVLLKSRKGLKVYQATIISAPKQLERYTLLFKDGSILTLSSQEFRRRLCCEEKD